MEEQQQPIIKDRQQAATDAGRATARPASASGDLESVAPGDAEGLAFSVTRQAHFSVVSDCRCLACGIDSLDCGLFVEWNSEFQFLTADLERGKDKATGTQGVLFLDGRCLILPGGKPPNYRWHLQWPEFHLFIGKSKSPQGKSPNVYLSCNARALWERSPRETIEYARQCIAELGGDVLQIKPSRVDLAADFFVPGDLTLGFLVGHRVPSHVAHSHHMRGDSLETFYQGAPSSPTRLRIYDKGLEIAKSGGKWWFLQVCNQPSEAHVWRVEYQLRRPTLKEFAIHTLDELFPKLGGLWEYLTGDWFSLRQDDNANVSRCTVHPWWQMVQGCASQFGEVAAINRTFEGEPADSSWFEKHCAGCLASFAARRDLSDFDVASELLVACMKQYWDERDFKRAVMSRAIPLGVSGCTEAGLSPDSCFEMDSDHES